MLHTMQTDPAEIAKRIRLARRLTGISQEDAARALGVTVRTFARWETAESLGFMSQLDRIAEEFDTTSDDLLGVGEDTGMEARLEAMETELRELKALLLDPARLKAAADALVAEEAPQKARRKRS